MSHVAVRGLTELRRALRDDKGMSREFVAANHHLGQIVLDEARPGISSESSGVASSGRAVRSTRGARLSFADVKSGGYLYGARHDRQRVGPSGRRYKGHNQFPGFTREGRHIEPTVDENLDRFADEYTTALDKVFDRNGVPRA